MSKGQIAILGCLLGIGILLGAVIGTLVAANSELARIRGTLQAAAVLCASGEQP